MITLTLALKIIITSILGYITLNSFFKYHFSINRITLLFVFVLLGVMIFFIDTENLVSYLITTGIGIVSTASSASIQSGRASACGAHGFRRCRTSSPASVWTSCSGTRTLRSSSSTRWRPLKSPRSWSTRRRRAWTSRSRRTSSRSRSAVAARTCGSPAS